jgi:hypothetical protein
MAYAWTAASAAAWAVETGLLASATLSTADRPIDDLVRTTAPVSVLTDDTGAAAAATVAKSVMVLAVCVWADGANVEGTPDRAE